MGSGVQVVNSRLQFVATSFQSKEVHLGAMVPAHSLSTVIHQFNRTDDGFKKLSKSMSIDGIKMGLPWDYHLLKVEKCQHHPYRLCCRFFWRSKSRRGREVDPPQIGGVPRREGCPSRVSLGDPQRGNRGCRMATRCGGP